MEDKVEQEIVNKNSEKSEAKKKGPFAIFRKIFEYILIAFIAVVAVAEVVGLATRSSNFGVPNIFGYQFLVVATDSMAVDENGEEVYPVGIGLICKKVDVSTIEVGDDITFYWEPIQSTITHRVYEIETDDSGSPVSFLCHGINVNATYYSPTQYQEVPVDQVLGKIVHKSYVLGDFITAMQTPYVVILLIFVPASFIAVSSVIDMLNIKKMSEEELEEKYGDEKGKKKKKKEDPNDPLSGLSEEEKASLKKQMIEEMLNSKKGEKDEKK